MFTNPHNQNLINDVLRVLGGETTETPVKPVPQWITEAAVSTAATIKESAANGEVMTLEIRKDILRKSLSEAISNCECSVNSETPLQFENAVEKALEEKAIVVPGKKVSEPSHKESELAKMGTKIVVPGKPVSTPQANELDTPDAVAKKTEKPTTKAMPKNVGLGSKGKSPKNIGEEVEAELRDFVTHLTDDEISALREIIDETR